MTTNNPETISPALGRIIAMAAAKMSNGSGPNLSDKSPSLKPAAVECPVCRDLGFLRREVPVTDQLFGKLLPCPACGQKRQTARRAQLQQLEGWLKEATFESFVVTAENRAAFEAALEFAETPTGLFTIWGDFGPGKTHLLAAIHNRLTAKGVSSLFTTLPDLVSQQKEAIGSGNVEDFYQFVSRHRVLLIDEVDKADLRNWTREQAFRLFNRRYNLAGETGTAMTMNKNPNVYDGEMGYLFSRMRDDRHRCVYLAGDNRPQAGLLGKLAGLKRAKGGR